MNEIVHKFLLAGYIFMPELHLKEPGFTYIACDSFNKHKEKIEKFMQTRNTVFTYRNQLVKLALNMIWFMVNQKIYQKELNQTKL